MKKSILILMFCIISIGAFLRIYKLGGVPVGLHRDEAILGYNGYSLLKTGGFDMSGDFLPLNLRSYIYSPAGYSYASIPFLALFGLSAFSTRFASAVFGTLTILMTFFMVRTLLKKKEHGEAIAVLTSCVLAISPWHINLSRTATENTIVVFFITLGLYLYLLWIEKNKTVWLLASYAAFAATLTLYQAPRAFLALFIPTLLLLNKKITQGLIIHTLLYIGIILIPLAVILTSPTLSTRLRTVSIFGTQETKLITDEQIREDGISHVPLIFTRLYHNKLLGYSGQFLSNYFAHFSYPFLFTDAAQPIRYKVPGASLLYIIELPLLLIGVWFLAKQESTLALFLFTWILLAPIGSALTFDDVPNLQRTLLIQPAVSLLIVFGLYGLLGLKKYRLPLFVGIGIMYIFCVTGYLHAYYVHQLVHQPYYRNEGYKDLVAKVNTLLPSYRKAVITNRETAPAIFFLFYSTYSPKQFQRDTAGTTMKDFDRINFGKYEFTTEECPVHETNKGTITGEKGVLYVNYATCTTPPGAMELTSIRRSDNTIVFKVLVLQ